MVHHLTYSTNILDTFSVLSSFNFAESIWDKYEKYAIPKIQDATIKLRGSLFYIKDLTPKQAEKELKSLNQIIPVLYKSKEMLSSIKDKEFQDFKSAAIEFFDTIDLLHDNLQDIAKIHSFYEMSMSVLSEDWNSKEDQHWDNY
ncbi:MAG: hypothetical protein COW67_11600 [Flavobacteriales bacterium CG18_big_fil_WC_8_21_14_2_50_32_9]|nr:MAG: hypothetical protein COW67_11600 [Flavobacteriales bacterium CG18_big_fil_WC_8_21_14_2_50_32_9]